MKNKWGNGIPNYKEKDKMTQEELLDFGMQIVKQFELDKNGYSIVTANNKIGVYPNFVAEKDNKLFFILVKVDVAPKMPVLSSEEEKIMIVQSKKFNAIPMFAPVGIGSIDSDRFKQSLALRGDGFYSKYVGLTEIN